MHNDIPVLRMAILSSAAVLMSAVMTGCAMAGATTPPQLVKEISVESSQFIDLLEHERSARNPQVLDAMDWRFDGGAIVTDGPGLKATVFDARSLNVHASLEDSRGGSGSAVAYSRDGKLIASGHSVVDLWDAVTHTKLRTIVGPYVDLSGPQPIGIKSLAFSPDGETLAVSYVRRKIPSQPTKAIWPIVLYRVATGEVVWNYTPPPALKDHQNGIVRVTTPIYYLPDGRHLIAGVAESTVSASGDLLRRAAILLLDTKTGQATKTIENIHVDSPMSLAVSADGQFAATGTSTGDTDSFNDYKTHKTTRLENKDPIRVWNLATGALVRELPVDSNSIALAFSPNGHYLVASQSNPLGKTLWVWDLTTGHLVQQIKTSSRAGPPLALAFSPDGQHLAAVAGDEIQIYAVKR